MSSVKTQSIVYSHYQHIKHNMLTFLRIFNNFPLCVFSSDFRHQNKPPTFLRDTIKPFSSKKLQNETTLWVYLCLDHPHSSYHTHTSPQAGWGLLGGNMTMSPELDSSVTKHLNNKSKVESSTRAPSAGTVAGRAERELATEPVPVRGERWFYFLIYGMAPDQKARH